jgi:hypothetical protein
VKNNLDYPILKSSRSPLHMRQSFHRPNHRVRNPLRIVTVGVLRIDATHQDVPFGKTMTAAIDGQIMDLARWPGLDLGPAGRS